MDDTMMWLVATVILVAIGGLLIFMLVLGGGEGLAEYLEQWCIDNPRICGVTDESSLNYKIAENSAEALACAINSVSLGQKKTDGCEDYVKKVTGSGGIIDSPFKTIGGILMASDYRNLMEELDYSGSNAPGIYPGPAGGQYNDFITGMATGEEIGLEIPQVDCTGSGDKFKCTVSGFNIPENYNNWFGNAKQVIGGFGDPSMIIYYTKFPSGEDDDWQGFTPWFRTLSGVVLLSACAGRLVGVAVNVGSKLVRGTQSLIAKAEQKFSRLSKLLPKSASNKLDDITKQISKTRGAMTNILRPVRNIEEATHVMLADDMVESAMSRASRDVDSAFELYYEEASRLSRDIPPKGELKDAFKTIESANRQAIEMTAENADLIISQSRVLTENIGETSFKQVLKSVYGMKDKQITEMITNANLLMTNPSIKARVLGQSAAGLGAWFAAYLDSSVGKFVNEFPNSLVLHVALRPDLRKTFTLDIPMADPDSSNIRSVDVSYGIPVMLDRSGLNGGVVHFYSVSPCKAEIEVRKSIVPCDNFVYDAGSKLSMCENEAGIIEAVGDILVKNHDCNGVKEIFSESESRLDIVAANLSSNMNSIPVYQKTDNYDKIYYPLLRPGVGEENGYLYFMFNRTAKDVTHVYANIGNAPNDNDAPMTGAREYEIDVIRVSDEKGYRLGSWKGVQCVVNVMGNTPERQLRIAGDDGCSLFTATEDDQDPDMGILEGDTVIRCVFDGKDGNGFIRQDYCALTSSGLCDDIRTSMTFYYNIMDSGSPDEFIGVKIQQSYTASMDPLHKEKAGRLILTDSPESDSERRDGRIDTVSYSYGKTKFSLIPEFLSSERPIKYEGWSSSFIDTDGDGKTDSIHNMNCNTPALLLEVKGINDDENEDSEGNNYCTKQAYRSTLETTVAITGGAVSVITSFLKLTGVGAIVGFAVDCGLGLWEVALSTHNWPSGGNKIFKPSFL